MQWRTTCHKNGEVDKLGVFPYLVAVPSGGFFVGGGLYCIFKEGWGWGVLVGIAAILGGILQYTCIIDQFRHDSRFRLGRRRW